LKILYVTAEASPFIKTGGLGDVAGSLPLEIRKLGHDIRVVLPLHLKIKAEYKDQMEKVCQYTVDLGWRNQHAGIFKLVHQDVIFYFIDNEYYFNRENPYGEFDDGERYGFFSKAVALLPKHIDFKPDVIHSNDWHSALVNLYIKDFAKGDDYYNSIKTIFTIHNLRYQGRFDPWILGDILGLSQEYFHDDGIKFFEEINYMKAGIVYSDILTTVSRSYAEEIKYVYFGEMLEETIRKHEDKLKGIVNGIDYNIYNPALDKHIKFNYSLDNLEDKYKNKNEIQRLYGLPEKQDIPILTMVTRLVSMKGIDLIKTILDELLEEDIQLIILGTGEKEYEGLLKHYEYNYPNKVAARMYFSEEESHKIYAGGDILLMPSMIEPCGISQLIALKYGTVPIVREVGGLKDTIIPYSKFTKEGNGFSFKNFNAHELLFTIKDALNIYNNEKDNWKILIENAMNSKYDWESSSHEYIELYEGIK